MSLSYEPLWKMLSQLGITKMEFAKMIDISNATLAKIGKNAPITLTTVEKICSYFNCKIENVVEYVPDKDKNQISLDCLTPGAIVLCSCWPLGTRARVKVLQRRNNEVLAQPSVIIKPYLISEGNYTNHFLVVPLSYRSVPTTILDISFSNLNIGDSVFDGYIEIGRIGYAMYQDCRLLLGHIPDVYMEKIHTSLEMIKPFIHLKE